MIAAASDVLRYSRSDKAVFARSLLVSEAIEAVRDMTSLRFIFRYAFLLQSWEQ